MDLLRSHSRFCTICPSTPLRHHPRRIRFAIRSSLPFPDKNAEYHRELQTAVDVVERACRLCVDVQKSLFSCDGRILEKNDQTPVTVADFGVQALISWELSKLFPSIPLVAEEDSAFLRSNNLVNSVLNSVTDYACLCNKELTEADVLEAIDRGGKDAYTFGLKPATYWFRQSVICNGHRQGVANFGNILDPVPTVLDPIDGTRGFVRGSDALYVVGLALVVEGEIVLGVMGCPNWKEGNTVESLTEASGTIMVAHVGCGTWRKQLSGMLSSTTKIPNNWTRCSVDKCCLVHAARFCCQDSQTWESLPLSSFFDATTDIDKVNDKRILLLSACCGSLCKYLMVASGMASAYILRARAKTIIKAWDHAVGMICVHEAGGKVTDWRGSQLDLAVDQVERRFIIPSGGVLVSNGSLHGKVLELISSESSAV